MKKLALLLVLAATLPLAVACGLGNDFAALEGLQSANEARRIGDAGADAALDAR